MKKGVLIVILSFIFLISIFSVISQNSEGTISEWRLDQANLEEPSTKRGRDISKKFPYSILG